MAKIVDFNFDLKDVHGVVISDPAFKWLKLIVGAQASEKESDFLKVFSLVEKINKNPAAVELDEGDESTVKKAIENFKQIDHLGNPRVNAYMKAQLVLAINDAKKK